MSVFKNIFVFVLFSFYVNHSNAQQWKEAEYVARQYFRAMNYDSAFTYYQGVNIVLQKDSFHTETRAGILDQMGKLSGILKKPGPEKKYYEEARDIREAIYGKQQPACKNSYYLLATYYSGRGDYNLADSFFVLTKKMFDMGNTATDSGYANFCKAFANFYLEGKQKENIDKAQPLLDTAMNIYMRLSGTDNLDYLEANRFLGRYFRYKNAYDSARKYYLQGLRLCKNKFAEFDQYGNYCRELGVLYKDNNKYDSALILLVEAKRVFEKNGIKNPRDYLLACVSLAHVYKKQMKYEAAEELYNMASKKFKGDDKQIECINGLASLYRIMGQYEKAGDLLAEAQQAIAAEKVNERLIPLTYYNLGNLYFSMQEYKKADGLYKQALSTIEKSEYDKQLHTDINIAIANILQLTDEYEKSKEMYGLAMKGMHTESLEYAQACHSLGTLLEKNGEISKAKKFYIKAKTIREALLGKSHLYYGATCASLANLNWADGDIEDAASEFNESFSADTANLYNVFDFTSEKEKETFVKNVLGEHDKAYSFYLSKKQISAQPYAISLFHRNLILSSLQSLNNELFLANDTVVQGLIDKWIELKKQLGRYSFMSTAERMDSALMIKDMEFEVEQHEKELQRWSARFNTYRQNTNWRDIQTTLDMKSASIEFASFRYDPGYKKNDPRKDSIVYVAIVLTKNASAPMMVKLFDEAQLTSLLNTSDSTSYEEQVNNEYSLLISKPGKTKTSLYQLIWQPLESILKDVDTVYYAPAGLLHKIAFAAIPVKDDMLLSDRYNLVQLSSTASITDRQQTVINRTDTIALYGGINYDDNARNSEAVLNIVNNVYKRSARRGLPDDRKYFFLDWANLSETGNEINVINQLDSQNNDRFKKYAGSYATEESVKAYSGNLSPAVLHFATHGFFFPANKKDSSESHPIASTKATILQQSGDPLIRSGLVFAGANGNWLSDVPKTNTKFDDGILTAREVADLYFPNTKLAVLSACETALGDIKQSEGVYGLQRAFQIAGVKNLVMSLWKVPSAETVEFMDELYKQLFSGKNVSNAFYVTQKTMRNKYKSEPYKWAAWVLIR